MKVLLFQVDGKFPNFALMRLARYHRDRNDSVFLTSSLHDVRFVEADRVYASSIFEFSRTRRAQLAEVFPHALTGGDGYKPIWNQLQVIGRDLGSNLREVITDRDPESLRADYSDYPNFEASIGYSQRGCRLDCSFCRMKTREGEARKVSGEPHPKHVVLLDNDFFGQREEWREQLREVKARKFKVCFNQGINIRLIDEEQARELKDVFYCDDQFKTRRLYTAWDNLGDEKVFKKGVEMLRSAGIPPRHLFVYMLVGYDHKLKRADARPAEEQMPEIFHRFNELVALGCRPYPMVFDRGNKKLCEFQRWVIRKAYEVVGFDEYDVNARGHSLGRYKNERKQESLF